MQTHVAHANVIVASIRRWASIPTVHAGDATISPPRKRGFFRDPSDLRSLTEISGDSTFASNAPTPLTYGAIRTQRTSARSQLLRHLRRSLRPGRLSTTNCLNSDRREKRSETDSMRISRNILTQDIFDMYSTCTNRLGTEHSRTDQNPSIRLILNHWGVRVSEIVTNAQMYSPRRKQEIFRALNAGCDNQLCFPFTFTINFRNPIYA